MSPSQESLFSWPDYLVFGLSLLLSSSIGIFYGVQDKRKKRNTVEDFLMAGRSMSVLPVSLSMFVSWISAISFLGDPVEVYYHGALYSMMGIGYCLAVLPVAQFFGPKFHRMKLLSAYEYMEKRYNRAVRLLASVTHGIAGGLFCGFVLYGPAICLAQVTGFSVWASIIGIGSICVFYTTLGGMKAVLWADTLQMVVMTSGLIAVVARGCFVLGGIGNVVAIAEARGRINILNFNPSPFVRSTFWTYVIGGFFRVFNTYIYSQTFIQRYGTLKTERDVKIAIYLNTPLFALFVTLFTLFGLVLVAYFDGCDPLTAGRIERKDQMVPLAVMELLGFIPGIPGLYLSSLFCASLSSLSSYLHSLSITLLKDIVEPAYTRHRQKEMSPMLSIVLSKVFCIVLGAIFIGFALILVSIEDVSIFQMSQAICGCFQGPVAALFFLGLTVPLVKTKGGLIASMLSLGVSIWWYMGSTTTDFGPPVLLPVNTDNCSQLFINVTGHSAETNNTAYVYESTTFHLVTSPANSLAAEGFSVRTLYQFSPLLYGALGFVITVIVAIAIGSLSALIKRKKWRRVDINEPEQKKGQLEFESKL